MANDRINDPSLVSSANLAYLGDCVYELEDGVIING